MRNSLLGGRHDRVVGCNDDDGDIRHLSTTGTHGGESLVTWGVKECYLASVRQLYVVCTDVLSNTTSLAGNHICVAYVVEERGLTMVNVAHDGDDRCA